MSSHEPRRLRRGWLRISIRACLLALLLLSICLAWFAQQSRRSRSQQQAVREIQTVGGMVKDDHHSEFNEAADGSTIQGGATEYAAVRKLRECAGECLRGNSCLPKAADGRESCQAIPRSLSSSRQGESGSRHATC